MDQRKMRFGGSRRAVKVTLLVTAVGLGLLGGAASAAPAKKTTGTVYASGTHVEGKDLYVSGDFKDSLLGRGAIVYVTQPNVSDDGSVHVVAREITIYTTKGSLRGSGEADQTFNADGSSDVTGGTFSLTKGTGAYKGHEFSGKFDGTFEDGVYTFKYKGIYK